MWVIYYEYWLITNTWLGPEASHSTQEKKEFNEKDDSNKKKNKSKNPIYLKEHPFRP
ncbi:MAG: hypothetical protein PHI50_04705 [Alphaproteobacteria bacterium]|nr:hypothetical protein [Alphaproteobacteria bacterium]